jgi:hypothetical protein
MIQYNLIRIAGTYLTDSGLSSGNRLISEVTGIDKLRLSRQSNVQVALDGTPYKQFSSNKGLPVSLKFPILPVATFNTIVNAINSADEAGTSISLYISGDIGTFDLSVVSSGIDAPATGLEAGLYSCTFNFVVSAQRRVLTAVGSYTHTGNSVTLTH